MLTLPIHGMKKENLAGYPADSGEDIAVPVGTEVVAVQDGLLVYSEWGHTPWVAPPDTAYSLLLLFDTPLVLDGVRYQYAWYTHLSAVYYDIPDDGGRKCKRIKQGDKLGKTGLGNNNAHLHFGILVNRKQKDCADWMSEPKLRKLLADIIDERDKPKPPPVDTKKKTEKGKIFYHDKKTSWVCGKKLIVIKNLCLEIKTGKAGLVVNGVKYIVSSIEAIVEVLP